VYSPSYNSSQKLLLTGRAGTVLPICGRILQVQYVHNQWPATGSHPSDSENRSFTNKSTNRAQIQPVAASQSGDILASQRRNRPVSPHLSIYQPQITWLCGAIMRNASIAITIPIYAFGAAYLVSPLFGWHLDTVSMVKWFGSFSVGSRIAMKCVFAFPFVFHVLHGLRHLIWDTGAMLTNKQVQITGWATVVASVLGTIGLVMW